MFGICKQFLADFLNVFALLHEENMVWVWYNQIASHQTDGILKKMF